MTALKYNPLPKDTPAFLCAKCGAVALNASDICKVQGIGRKADWCGSSGQMPPKTCHKKNATSTRWQCRTCGQTSVNNELLCEPAVMELVV